MAEAYEFARCLEVPATLKMELHCDPMPAPRPAAAALPFPSSSPFRFFGQPQPSVYLCNNGVLSFGYGLDTYVAQSFPIIGNGVIAPL